MGGKVEDLLDAFRCEVSDTDSGSEGPSELEEGAADSRIVTTVQRSVGLRGLVAGSMGEGLVTSRMPGFGRGVPPSTRIQQCVAVAFSEAEVRHEGSRFFVLTTAHDGYNLTWLPSLQDAEKSARDDPGWVQVALLPFSSVFTKHEGLAARGPSKKQEQWADLEPLNSFIHIHLGFRGEGLPTEHCPDFPAQWGVVNDWADLEQARNVVLVSVPSLLDPDFAPKGYHSLHAYTPATERWADWEHLDRRSAEYKEKKKEAADFLYSAIERQVPDIRSRVVFEQVGTPLTHERFLRKPRGAYGWRVLAGANLPGHKTPLPGLHICRDSTYPGIGVPSAAMGGHICANNILSLPEHWAQLDRIKDWHYELDM